MSAKEVLTSDFDELDLLGVNTIRVLSAEMVEEAQSGHPGMPMGVASIAYVLWQRFLRFNPKEPQWINRDRFVLSNGHGSALLYSMLHLTGYDASLEHLKKFRQLHSPCAGHPEFGELPGIETTTGPLGQGLGVAVGMALAERYLANTFNTSAHSMIDYHTYCMVGDGCLMEGITSEASSFAGHQGLGKLIVLFDSNRISIDGSTDLAFTEDVQKRYESYGWQVLDVDGLDLKQLVKVIETAKQETQKPSLIICRTHIGYGSPNKQDSESSHGAPLGADELKATKEKLAWPESKTFSVPGSVKERMLQFSSRHEKEFKEWSEQLGAYEKAVPEKAKLFLSSAKGELPGNLFDNLPRFKAGDAAAATRSVSGKVINALAEQYPLLLGGSADLSGSNNTVIKGTEALQKQTPLGRNIHFGVREHAMGAILNGLSHCHQIIAYGGTFLTFSDYMRPSIRLAALMGLPAIYVFTHDSIFLGEDGPTHQSIEHIPSLRLIPNLRVIRPADAKETVAAWHFALASRKLGPKGSPVALCLSRQKLPVLEGTQDDPQKGVALGGYVVHEGNAKPELILVATGSEVQLAVTAAQELEKQGLAVRVVSMPCKEVFRAQSQAYQDEVLTPACEKRFVIEAAVSTGWQDIAGAKGRVWGIDRFGLSAPAKDLAQFFGFTPENIVKEAKAYLQA